MKKKLPLFLVSRIDGVGYDETREFVIAAIDENDVFQVDDEPEHTKWAIIKIADRSIYTERTHVCVDIIES